MKISTYARGAAVVATVALAPQALAATAQPLPQRDGVVVAWQPGARTAVVVTRDQRVYVVHGLRRVVPGTRVRVEGIKWGTPTSGIKWSAQPSGIKWAVRTAVNGTVASTVTTTGKATTMSLRATVVKRFGKRAVAVSVPGATFVVPMRRGAVWLPGGKLTNAVAPVGAMGSVSVFRLAVDARGRVAVASAKQVALPKPQGAVPFAGKVTGVSMTDRTITIQASTLAGYPVTLVVTVPMAFDLLRYPIGAQVAGTVVPADPASSTALFATSVTLNRSFAAADSPLGTIVATPPDPADIAAIDALQAAWRAGNDTGKFTQAGTGLFTSKMERLDRIQRWIEWNDISTATRELGIFEADVNAANTNPAVKPPATITDVAFQQAVIAQSAALRTQITAP